MSARYDGLKTMAGCRWKITIPALSSSAAMANRLERSPKRSSGRPSTTSLFTAARSNRFAPESNWGEGSSRARRDDRSDPDAASRASLYEDPLRLEKWKRDEADDRRGGDEHGSADLPAKQHDQTAQCHHGREPVADRDLAQEHAGPKDGADGGGVCAVDKALHVGVLPVTNEDRGHDEHEQERREEDSDRRGQGTPEAAEEGAGLLRRHEIADERRRDHDGARA